MTLMCALSLVSMVIGFQLVGPTRSRQLANDDEELAIISAPFAINFGLCVVLLGVFAYVLAVHLTVGFSVYFDAGYAGRALVKRSAGPVELGLYYIVIGYLFVLYGFLFHLQRKKSLLIGSFLVLFFITFIIFISSLGIRRPSFFIAMSSGLLIFFRLKGRVSWSFLSVTIISLLMFGVFARFRQVLSDHGAIEALDYVIKNISFEWFDLSPSELGAPFRSMLDVYEPWVEKGYHFGASFVEAFVNIIPSTFGLNAPSLSVQYTHQFFSVEYISIGGNMGFFPVAEAYINMGAIGVFVEFLILGVLIKKLENHTHRVGTPACSVFYAVMGPWFFFLIRTDFSSFIKSFFYSVIPIFVVYFFVVQFRKKFKGRSALLNERSRAKPNGL